MDIIFIRHLSFFFMLDRLIIFFFLEFALGAIGFWEKIKLADYKNKA